MTQAQAISHHARLFVLIMLNEARRYAFYPFEFFTAFVNRAITILLISLFWVVTAEFGTGGELDSRYLLGYYMVLSGLLQMSFANLGVANSVLKKIKDGRISSQLLRPIDTFRYEFASLSGWQIQFLAVSVILSIIGIVIASDGFNPLLASWAIVNMFGINYGINRAAACIGFYVVESAGIKNAVLHVLRLLQGMLIPLSLLPVLAQDILALTPFPGSLYMPTAILLGEEFSIGLYALNTVWAIVLLYTSKKLWSRSLRAYEAVGI